MSSWNVDPSDKWHTITQNQHKDKDSSNVENEQHYTAVTITTDGRQWCITYLRSSCAVQAQWAQCWNTPIDPDRRSPWPPHLRTLPSSSHTNTAADSVMKWDNSLRPTNAVGGPLWTIQCAWDEECMLPLSPQMGLKTQSDRFFVDVDFVRIKSARKFLCAKTFTAKVVRHWLRGTASSTWNFGIKNDPPLKKWWLNRYLLVMPQP